MAAAEPAAVAQRVQAIEAGGRKGLWLAPAAMCRRDAKAGRTATLLWNVKASGARHVVAYVIDKTGKEVKFRMDGPIGEQQTGPWLRPGMAFRLRDARNEALLGSVVLADAPCA